MLILLIQKILFNNYQSILLYYYKKFWKIIEWTIEIIILRYENRWINIILFIYIILINLYFTSIYIKWEIKI